MSAWCRLSSRVSRPALQTFPRGSFLIDQTPFSLPVLRIRDIYPGSCFYPSRIPNLGSRIQKQERKSGVKKICRHSVFCSHKFHKIVNYFIFETLKKKIWANFQRIIELFTQKIVTKLSKIWVWDPVTEIRNKPILDPGSRGQKGTGSRIRNTAHCLLLNLFQAGLICFCPWCPGLCGELQMWAHILLEQPDENMPIRIVKSSCKLACTDWAVLSALAH